MALSHSSVTNSVQVDAGAQSPARGAGVAEGMAADVEEPREADGDERGDPLADEEDADSLVHSVRGFTRKNELLPAHDLDVLYHSHVIFIDV